ncbi:MAG: 16S rRNA (cytosine(1402)-N(4))-methyltransferase RsmH [Bacteroidota bacterium]
MMYHNPVLLKESLDGLKINPEGTYVDVTFGGGGHSKEILKHLTTGRLYAFDQDEDASTNMILDERFLLIKQNFKYLKNFLKMYNALPIDGLLADLGVSSHQFDVPERGFSTRFDAKLDMRMDTKSNFKASDIINNYTEGELKRVFKDYGEVDNPGKLAHILVEARKVQHINTVNELKFAVSKCLKRGKENQFLAQIFQALRIEVNKEMDSLEELLIQSIDVLKPGGRLVVISYHSLEDRLVKNIMRSGKFEGEIEKDFYGNKISPFIQVSRKPIVPSEEENATNSRARSAKLRIAEKV